MLSQEDQSSLLDLAWHWEGAYVFTVIDDVWSATPVDAPAQIMTADRPEELRQLVRDDYSKRKAHNRVSDADLWEGSSL